LKLGFRIQYIAKRIAARTSVKRIVKNELKLKAPRGYVWITNPKKFVYNKVYNKTSAGCMFTVLVFIGVPLKLIVYVRLMNA
jgi:hypothetical protein